MYETFTSKQSKNEKHFEIFQNVKLRIILFETLMIWDHLWRKDKGNAGKDYQKNAKKNKGKMKKWCKCWLLKC